MAKITRVFHKIFGDSGTSGNFGVFGSKAASAIAYSKDVSTIQSLGAWLTGLQDAVIGGRKVQLEDLNSALYHNSRQTGYLFQEGVAEYDAGTTYFIGSYAKVAGVPYVSIADTNVGNDPATSVAYWTPFCDLFGTPTGAYVPFAGTTAPTGWMICDGTAISRSTYARLFAAIGTAWGVGNGTTTFNIPDMREKTVVGYKSGSAEFGTLGGAYGAKTHTLSINEMPSHTHMNNYALNDSTRQASSIDQSGSRWKSSIPTEPTGDNQPHNNIQPSGVANFIIKV